MKKYAIVGAGGRALAMFAKPLATELQGVAELVGVYDVNPVRAKILSEQSGNVPLFDDFDTMISVAKPDAVIVTTPDNLHDHYIIRTLEAGCDAISEKPMTTDAEKCRAIIDAEKRTGKRVIVTFNCRFMPYVVRIKELLKEGTIGDILHVTLNWSLDTRHGADYFRRWHRQMKNSGGLLLHKSTHHFDMVNWWLNDEPESVTANGSRLFYGPTRVERGQTCSTCSHTDTCEFHFDITANEFTKSFYKEAEKHDGYFRDQCVFGDDIDIYDTMSLNVKYKKGTQMSYSLNAYSPYEGWKATFVGTKGRIEAEDNHSGAGHEDPNNYIRIFNRKNELITVQSRKAGGAHGGGDQRLRRMIFVGDVADPLGQMAGSRAGAMSLLIGAAANISITDSKKVVIEDLLKETVTN
ncbi:Gfo/Idh/MocA family oxidoreductase [Paenibacillus hemerocallicola]|uniref:Gfo/Idh/MocA family oxidoreductase n=1 Tax=Paenibacillus hemerocallicola TaxID=1172614 RepID=A0A5C4TH31_9BACL|nr:Gfo/Idh/MocA family oxidoreductase [Paenibacillus hemerocallicola]TNJ68052.1 Gfo/Idh/MocA family oxidoreductase [Paenibacillus hemerocallicola]